MKGDRPDIPSGKLKGGSRDYRAFVGCAGRYDVLGASQFNLLTLGGLREGHTLLDIGCGSLRAGRLFIPYLLPDRYFGIEPEQWLLEEGIRREIGEDAVRVKRPRFSNTSDFDASGFGVEFDYVLAHSIFSHTPQPQVRTCLASAASVMKSSSVFFATFHVGRTNYSGDRWAYPELVPYTRSWIKTATAAAGLRMKFIDWPHAHRQRWVVLWRADSGRHARYVLDPARDLSRAARKVRARRAGLLPSFVRRRRA